MPRAGMRIVKNRLPLIAAAIVTGLEEVVSETATAIEQDVKGGAHAAPYRTGNLRRAYHKQKTGTATYEVGNDVGIAHYAVHVEYGTWKMAARPHLRPAAEAQRNPFHQRILVVVQGAA